VALVLLGGGAYGVSWYSQPQRAITHSVTAALTAPTSVTELRAQLSSGQSRLTVDGPVARDRAAVRANLRLSARLPSDTAGSASGGTTGSTSNNPGSDTTGDARNDTADNPGSDAAAEPALDLALRTDLVADPHSVYLRARGLPALYDEIVAVVIAQQMRDDPTAALGTGLARSVLDALVRPVVTRVEGRWLEVDRRSLVELGQRGFRCDTVAGSLSTAELARLARTYAEHPPFTVRRALGTRDGDVGYLLTPDAEGMRALLTTLGDTTLGRTLRGCAANSGDQATPGGQGMLRLPGAADLRDVQVRVWLDRWTHQLHDVTVSAHGPGGGLQVQLRPRFDEQVSVRTPAETVPLSGIVRQIQATLAQLS
jgi:hypothetical protein